MIVITFIVCALPLYPLVQANGSKFSLAYLAVDDTTPARINLNIVAPDSIGQPKTLWQLPEPESRGELPQYGNMNVSPDGRWLTLLYAVGLSYRAKLRLISIETGRLRQVAEFASFLNDDDSHAYEREVYHWSPDSKYLAFNGAIRQSTDPLEEESLATDIFVYSPITETTIGLTTKGTVYLQFAWSNDSKRIAVVGSHNCKGECELVLDIFDVMTRQVVQSVVVDIPYKGVLWDPLCRLEWSPDNAYISFMMPCDSSISNGYQDLYVLDVALGNISQVTDAKLDMDKQSTTTSKGWFVSHAEHVSLWYDAKTLLVGTYAYRSILDEKSEVLQEIAIYRFPGGKRVIQSGYIVKSVAPVNTAFRNSVVFEVFEGGPSEPTIKRFVVLADFNGKTLVNPRQLPWGCRFYWSPDGEVLAYEEPEGTLACYTDYVNRVQGFILVNRKDAKLTRFPQEKAIVIVGWVRLPQ